jgi:acyl-CoA synthetase (AMP-forming)/AMP-acid ligase II
MERRWYKVWPVWAPKTIEVERPVSEYIRIWAAYTPDRVALSFYGRDVSYGELNRIVDQLAWGLVDLGVRKGDRVGVHMENCPQFVIAYYAVLRAGGVVVPVNPMFKGAELEHEMNDSGAETLIGLDSLYPELEKVLGRTKLKNIILTSMQDFVPGVPVLPLPPEAKHEKHQYPGTLDFQDLIARSKDVPICRVEDLKADLALLQYTGGTTGTPKGAMITHHALASAAVGSTEWYRHRESDAILGVTPFFHVMGQVNLMCISAVCGGRLVILSRFSPDVAARAISHYRITFWVAATPMIIGLLDLPELGSHDLTSFRCIVTGGASVPIELQTKLTKVAPYAAIVEGYGLSETASSGGACTPVYQYRPGFVGIPQIGVDMKIVDPESKDKELPANREGEIAIKAPSMMTGYWNRPEETKEMLRDGWLYTGDTGLMDEDGFIKFLGRTRELIKCSGFSVFPAEVEDLLYRHPAVREAAVIGVPDPYRGESPKAFVILKDEYEGKVTEKELLDWSKDNMAAYKRPKYVEFRTELPKSNAGKLLRRVLVAEEQTK